MLRPRQQAKLARGAEDRERLMSEKLNAAVAVIGNECWRCVDRAMRRA